MREDQRRGVERLRFVEWMREIDADAHPEPPGAFAADDEQRVEHSRTDPSMVGQASRENRRPFWFGDDIHVVRRFELFSRHGLPLLVHGEVTDASVDVFDREAVFLDRELAPLLAKFPGLRVVVEHITTREAVVFVRAAGANVAATITAHHLLLSRNAMFAGGLRPHAYCLPVLKREAHRAALVEAATSGEPRFFLGTDSAPHARTAKEAACGCAGIYTAHAAIELYAEAFAAAGAIDRLEGFACRFGPRFYGLPVNSERVRLIDEAWTVPASYPLGAEELVPLRAGAEVGWRLV